MSKIKNLVKLYQLLKKKPEAIDALSVEDIDKMENEKLKADTLGDGKAEFFGEPTSEEVLAFEREQAGTNAWYERLKKLI